MAGLRTMVALALALGIVTAGCSSAGATPAQGAVVIGTGSSASLGTFLTDTKGMTLYTHSGDNPTASTCTGSCASTWPPLTVPAGVQPSAAAGVTGTLGTLTRADGARQVTYNGLPLYLWQGDAKAGDATGDGVGGFAIAKAAAATAPAGSGGPFGTMSPGGDYDYGY